MIKSPANWKTCLLDQSMLTWAGTCLCVSDCACVSGLCRSAEDFLLWSILTCLAASSSLRWDCRSWCQPVLRSMTSTSITATTSTVTQGKLLGFRFPHNYCSLVLTVTSDLSNLISVLQWHYSWCFCRLYLTCPKLFTIWYTNSNTWWVGRQHSIHSIHFARPHLIMNYIF